MDNQAKTPGTNLLTCPDCGHAVSPRAVSCPQCGCQFKATTIERTSKSIKAFQIFFVGIAGVAFLGWLAAPEEIGIRVILFIGLVGFLVARLMAWWKHG